MAESRQLSPSQRRIQDVLCLTVPSGLDLETEESKEYLQQLACAMIAQQFAGRSVLPILVIEKVEWLVTDDPEEAATFQPVHDCEECRIGGTKSAEFLRDNPGERVALGNLTYVENWFST